MFKYTVIVLTQLLAILSANAKEIVAQGPTHAPLPDPIDAAETGTGTTFNRSDWSPRTARFSGYCNWRYMLDDYAWRTGAVYRVGKKRASSLDHCGTKCCGHNRCLSYEFDRYSRRCYLYSTDFTELSSYDMYERPGRQIGWLTKLNGNCIDWSNCEGYI